MTMLGLTPDQRRVIEQAGNEPVRISDPDTHEAYILVREEVYRRLGGIVGAEQANQSTREAGADYPVAMPEVIRRSKEAFQQALPGLLAQPRLRGRWVVYQGGVRIGIARKPETLVRECLRRGLTLDQYYLASIRPHAVEPEEVDPSLFEFEEVQSRQ